MLDGILDLLSSILVLGVVVAIAFGFIVPLVGEDVMQYSEIYEDKALVGNVINYDDPEMFDTINKRYYSYPELVMVMAVQTSRMEDPKAINLRDLVEGTQMYTASNDNTDINIDNGIRENANGYMGYSLYVFAENGRGTDALGGTGDKPNVGTVKFTETYPLEVDNFASLLSKRNLLGTVKSQNMVRVKENLNGNFNADGTPNLSDDSPFLEENITIYTDGLDKGKIAGRRYYLKYHYALPDDNTSIVNAGYDATFDDEEMYMVHIYDKNDTKITNKCPSGDTGEYYQNRINDLRRDIED